jgi:hypothetical protein
MNGGIEALDEMQLREGNGFASCLRWKHSGARACLSM